MYNILIYWASQYTGFYKLFVILFIKQIFIESLLYVRYDAKSWICNGDIFPQLYYNIINRLKFLRYTT